MADLRKAKIFCEPLTAKDREQIKDWDLVFCSEPEESYLWPNTICASLDNVVSGSGMQNLLIPEKATRHFKNALSHFSDIIDHVLSIWHLHNNLTVSIQVSPTDEGLESFIGAKPDERWHLITIFYDELSSGWLDIYLTENIFLPTLVCNKNGLEVAKEAYQRIITPKREIMFRGRDVKMMSDEEIRLYISAEKSAKLLGWHFRNSREIEKSILLYTYQGPSVSTQTFKDLWSTFPLLTIFELGAIDQSVWSHTPLPHAENRWPHLRENVMALQLAIYGLCSPPYVILEIIDWLPFSKRFTHMQKIKFIVGVHESIQKLKRRNYYSTLADRVKSRSRARVENKK